MKSSLDSLGVKALKVLLILLAVIFGISFLGSIQKEPSFVLPAILGIVLIFIIWAYPSDETKGLKNRLTHYKKFKNRAGLSIITIAIFLFSIPTIANNIKESYIPAPTISILNSNSDNIDIGTGKTIILQIKIENGDELQINSGSIQGENGLYTYTVDLSDSTETTINLSAKNKYKNTSKKIEVIRMLTEEEKTALEQKTAKEKAESEAKRVAEEKAETERKAKEEAYLNSPEYKNKIIKEKLEKIISEQELSLARTCREGVKAILKAPSTADFPTFDYNFFTNGDQIIIKSYVDAQNSFGAQIRSNFICYFKLNGENVSLVDVNLE